VETKPVRRQQARSSFRSQLQSGKPIWLHSYERTVLSPCQATENVVGLANITKSSASPNMKAIERDPSGTLFRMSCPYCGGHLEFSAVEAGQDALCPHCQRIIILRASPAPPAVLPGRQPRAIGWWLGMLVIVLVLGGLWLAGSLDQEFASLVGSLALLALLVGIYFTPTFVAGGRGHPNTSAIVLLNLFLGWTFVGWVVALVWSVTAIERRR
jgi:hypothetical protein